jgi:SAM-dependent methyltransferase
MPTDDAMTAFYAGAVRYSYYRWRLTEYICRLLPAEGPLRLLDVGAGDGSMAALLGYARPETWVVGAETLIRSVLRNRGVALVRYDGTALPFGDRSFDVALLSNVVHHASDQAALVREVCRVTRRRVIVKDHLAETRLAYGKLAILDVLGNRRFGASTTGHYQSTGAWDALIGTVDGWEARGTKDLTFRTGVLAAAFENRLEAMLVLDRVT